MTFFGLTPLVFALVAGGAAALLAVLHLLRVRPQEVAVPTLLFWKQAVEETRARTLIKRFRHPRTWLLLTALAALMALALAEPETEGTLAETRHEVLVLDLSESMAAPSMVTGKSRLDVAREEAAAYVGGLALRDRCAVAVAWSQGTFIIGLDTPRPTLLERLGEVETRGARADLVGSLALARSLVRGRTNPRVLVWTDRDDLVTGDDDVPAVVRPIGGPASDMAITGIAFTDKLWVEVSRSGETPSREIVVSNDPGGPVLATRPLDRGAAGRAWIPIEGLGLDGRVVSVALEPGDAVSANDRVKSLDLPRRTVGTVFVEEALSATARSLVASDPALALAATREEAAVIFGPGPEGDVPAGDAPVAFSPATLLRETVAPLRFPALPPGTRTLAPSDAESFIVLRAGDAVLARTVGEGPRRVEIVPGLLAPDSAWTRDPIALGAIIRILREAAGVMPGAVVLPGGEAIELPVCWFPRGKSAIGNLVAHLGGPFAGIVGRTSEIVLPAGYSAGPHVGWRHLVAAASAPAAARSDPGTPPPEPQRGGIRPWEGLAVLVLILGLLDAGLHLRGRIP